MRSDQVILFRSKTRSHLFPGVDTPPAGGFQGVICMTAGLPEDFDVPRHTEHVAVHFPGVPNMGQL